MSKFKLLSFHPITRKKRNVEKKFIIINEALDRKLITNLLEELKIGEVEIIDRKTLFVPTQKCLNCLEITLHMSILDIKKENS